MRTAKQSRRQRTVLIVHVGLGLVVEEEDVVLVADAVDADAADLVVVVAAPVAEAIVALAAVVVEVTSPWFAISA